VGKVKFPKHRGHRERGSLQSVRIEVGRAFAPQSLDELAATGVVFVGLIASPAIDVAWEVTGFEEYFHVHNKVYGIPLGRVVDW